MRLNVRRNFLIGKIPINEKTDHSIRHIRRKFSKDYESHFTKLNALQNMLKVNNGDREDEDVICKIIGKCYADISMLDLTVIKEVIDIAINEHKNKMETSKYA